MSALLHDVLKISQSVLKHFYCKYVICLNRSTNIYHAALKRPWGIKQYSLILGYLGEPMRLIVPPHQDLVVGYLAEHKVS